MSIKNCQVVRLQVGFWCHDAGSPTTFTDWQAKGQAFLRRYRRKAWRGFWKVPAGLFQKPRRHDSHRLIPITI